MSTEIVKATARPVVDLFEASREKIYEIVPRRADPGYLIRTSLAFIGQTDDILKCTPKSILLACCEGFRYGLSFGGSRPQAYIVPFFNKDRNEYIATFMLGYRGMIDLAGPGLAFGADVVYENDDFEPPAEVIDREGAYTAFRHRRAIGPRGKRIGAWARARHIDGRVWVEFMDNDELMRIKARSAAGRKGFSPWQTDEDEMCKKTPLRRLHKRMPIDLVSNIPDDQIPDELPALPDPIAEPKALESPQAKSLPADETQRMPADSNGGDDHANQDQPDDADRSNEFPEDPLLDLRNSIIDGAAEKWHCTFEIASGRLDRYTAQVMKKPLEAINEKQLRGVAKSVAAGDITLVAAGK